MGQARVRDEIDNVKTTGCERARILALAVSQVLGFQSRVVLPRIF